MMINKEIMVRTAIIRDVAFSYILILKLFIVIVTAIMCIQMCTKRKKQKETARLLEVSEYRQKRNKKNPKSRSENSRPVKSESKPVETPKKEDSAKKAKSKESSSGAEEKTKEEAKKPNEEKNSPAVTQAAAPVASTAAPPAAGDVTIDKTTKDAQTAREDDWENMRKRLLAQQDDGIEPDSGADYGPATELTLRAIKAAQQPNPNAIKKAEQVQQEPPPDTG